MFQNVCMYWIVCIIYTCDKNFGMLILIGNVKWILLGCNVTQLSELNPFVIWGFTLCLKNLTTTIKQGNRHPQARRTGLVPAGVNHRAPDQA